MTTVTVKSGTAIPSALGEAGSGAPVTAASENVGECTARSLGHAARELSRRTVLGFACQIYKTGPGSAPEPQCSTLLLLVVT